ncbi:MAG TPA: RNA-binding protein [Rhizomicrobium sp.]
MRERPHAGGLRDRRCIVTREGLPESRLVRFVVGPENEIVADLAAKLPGRGIWVSATRDALERALQKNLFSKAAKTSVRASADLPARVEALLVARMQDHLGLARRAGVLVLGFDGVVRALGSRRKPTVLVEARDGADDGRRKVLAAARAQGIEPIIIDVLGSDELSVALGRETVIHGALFPGPLAERLALDAERLEGFRPHDAKRTGPSPVPDER